MTPLERIDYYLSNQLPANEVAELEHDLQQDPELRGLLDSVDIARRTIRTQGIRAEVGEVHRTFMADYRQQIQNDRELDDQGTRVMPLPDHWAGRGRLFGWTLRVAAAVLLAVVGYSGYQFAALDRQAVYDGVFVEYRLPTTRGTGSFESVLDSLYQTRNYAAVVQRLATVPSPQPPRQQFLAAMAHLQLRQYTAAIEQFERLQNVNRRSDTPDFEQEADYYRALAELGAGNYERAYTGLENIHNNPRHLFHNNVLRSDLWKVKLLAYQ